MTRLGVRTAAGSGAELVVDEGEAFTFFVDGVPVWRSARDGHGAPPAPQRCEAVYRGIQCNLAGGHSGDHRGLDQAMQSWVWTPEQSEGARPSP